MEDIDEESLGTIDSVKDEAAERQDTSSNSDLAEMRTKTLHTTVGSRYKWKLLAEKVLKQKDSTYESPKFLLFKPTSIPLPSIDGSWYRLTTYLNQSFFDIHFLSFKSTTLDDLIGYNNTGNVRIWPSEEFLAHYFLMEKIACKNKDVLELGAGMTGLVGLAACMRNARRVVLTDGHEKCVSNLKRIVTVNNLCDLVDCIQLDWASQTVSNFLFDIITCADCLFFVELHASLMKCISKHLKIGGEAYIMAPNRNDSGLKFLNLLYQNRDMWESIKIHFNLPDEFSDFFHTQESQEVKIKADTGMPILFILKK